MKKFGMKLCFLFIYAAAVAFLPCSVNAFLLEHNSISLPSQQRDIGTVRKELSDKGQRVTMERVSLARGGFSKLQAWPLKKDPKGVAPDFPLTTARVAITIAATVGTWYAQTVGHSNVMASAAITLVCSMCFDRRLGQAAFCGSFAGMSSSMLVGDAKWALALGALSSAFFELFIHSKNMFLGVGGRLGATAFVATLIIALVQNISTGVAAFTLAKLKTSFFSDAVMSMIVWHAIGSAATIILREASDESSAADPVRASAVVGLLGALVLKDKAAALGVYGGSFVGMSLPSRLMYGILPGKLKPGAELPTPSNMKLILAFAGAGCLGGLVHGLAAEAGVLAGAWGGKAGLFAFIGCLIYRGLGKARAAILKRDIASELSVA